MSPSAPVKHSKPVGQILIDRKLITAEQIDEALKLQKSSGNRKLLGEVIIELGFCTVAQVAEALACSYGVPFARLAPNLVDPKITEVLPRDFLDSNVVIPLFKVDNVLTVAVTEPSNVFLVEEIAQLADCAVQIVAALKSDIDDLLKLYRSDVNDFAIQDILADHEQTDSEVTDLYEIIGETDVESAHADAPVVQLVNHLISCAVREGASDIHIEPDEKALRVRFRIDGALIERFHPPFQLQPAIVSRIKIMAGLDISERRLPQDGAISVTVGGGRVELRVSTLANKFGEKVVLRVIDTRKALVTLDQLGLSQSVYDAFLREARKPHGIILVTGPTGSGKSTTLYAVLNELRDPAINICTVEDPVEFQVPGVNQFQVHEKIGLGFANVLRSLLRQDPDVIMLGEIRDPETSRTAVQAALTGHLVLSTLHTNDSPSAVTRLQNLGVRPYLVSASLVAVLAQRLVRAICRDCKRAVEPSPSDRKTAEGFGVTLDRVFAGRGCSQCNQVGMKGRVGIFELLVPDDDLRGAIASGAPLNTIRAMAEKLGMMTLLQSGFEKVREGSTTVEEVLRVTAGL